MCSVPPFSDNSTGSPVMMQFLLAINLITQIIDTASLASLSANYFYNRVALEPAEPTEN